MRAPPTAASPGFTRRDFLRTTAGAAAVVGLTGSAQAAAPSGRTRVLRVAHLTDTHVFAERGAPEGLAAALRHAQAQAEKPDLMFLGGDLIMDALKKPKDEALAQWEIWRKVLAAELRMPAHVCLGNHDVWGWALDSQSARRDALYGKAMAMEQLALKDRFYSFDQGGWHFVVLDSTHMTDRGQHPYTAKIDDAQFAWLEQDLRGVKATTPICVLSHIPILAASVFFDGKREESGDWQVPGAWMHIDARRLKDLFRRHPNVKVCLSGHVHLVDDVTYLGVRYLCNGAVCGGWWKGPYQEFGPAYALVDFYDDGSVENRLVGFAYEGHTGQSS